jgi:hypothetical protein
MEEGGGIESENKQVKGLFAKSNFKDKADNYPTLTKNKSETLTGI